MKKITIKTIALAAITATVGFSSCTKNVEEIKETVAVAEDYAASETAFADAFNVIDDIASTDGRLQKNGSTILPSGAEVVFTDSLFTDGDGVELYIDFGTSSQGILCLDGKYRSGRINLTLSDKYGNIGTVATATLTGTSGFKVGTINKMFTLEGSVKATRTDTEKVRIEVTGGKVTSSEGSQEFYSDKTIERTLDANGPGVLGDEFTITGSGGGKNIDGTEYTVTIKTPLVRKNVDNCSKTFTKGVIELVVKSSGLKSTIDFDPDKDGACDNKIKYTNSKGISQNITID